jgi:hypothetical protein
MRCVRPRLDPVRWGGENGIGGDLRPGASGGGHGHAWHGWLRDLLTGPDNLQVVQGVPPLPSSMATVLPTSMTLPPPIAATTSAPCSRAAATPARANSTVGSPATGNTAAGSRSPASKLPWRAGLAPVHTSTRDPSPATTPGSSAARPGPAMIRPAVANSKSISMLSSCYTGPFGQAR